MKKRLTIGTRGSDLALWQAKWVKSALLRQFPDLSVDLAVIKTRGDKILDVPLAQVGGKGLFVKEIEEAMLDGKIDVAVHSMKDMPGEVPKGLCIGAIPERENPHDVLISKGNRKLTELPAGARIGTSSLRRASQLLHFRPDFKIAPLRGNPGPRIEKLTAANLDAIVLAAAGVKRLNLEDKISEYIDAATLIPAVGQGALCIEIRDNDPEVFNMVGKLDHSATRSAITAERAFLQFLDGGCQVPMAAYAVVAGTRLDITAMVAEIDGSRLIMQAASGQVSDAAAIGTHLAQDLVDRGAGEILVKLTREFHTNAQ
ncbi:MAG: hydroxymethylbilane synthase [Desulfobacterales bacterium CG23_combo_of_CG06-09_8_20_14_all_51_8]|nr:MAG: hydroxymethylbilane synthase [Desulfobacterales bacterium CG23_combo_of_CG06-09_8_20_14_all_51_8]